MGTVRSGWHRLFVPTVVLILPLTQSTARVLFVLRPRFAEHCPKLNVVNCRQKSCLTLSAVKVAFSVGLLVNECLPLVQNLLNEFTVQTALVSSPVRGGNEPPTTPAHDASRRERKRANVSPSGSTSTTVKSPVQTWTCKSCGATNVVGASISCSLCRRKRGSAWPALSVSTYAEAEVSGFNVIVYDVPVSASAFIKSWDVMQNSVKVGFTRGREGNRLGLQFATW